MTVGTVRLCSGADITALVVLQRLCFPADRCRGVAWTSTALAAHLEAVNHIVTLVSPGAADEEAGDDSPSGPEGGFLVARWVADEAEILLLGVAPAWRRRGLASVLTEDFLARAARAGVRRCHLEVARDNFAALTLYRTLGFTPVGRRKGYYNHGLGPKIDALLLCKTL